MNIDAISNSLAGSKPANSHAGNVPGKDDFLRLLVTQLQHQNPTNPMSNEEFIAQSAQFSALEQMTDLNASVKSLLELQKSSGKTAALNLIGRQVVAQQKEIQFNGSPVDLNYSLASDASVTITVCDLDGEPLRSIEVGEQLAGNHASVWDGLDDSGLRLPDGQYTYQVSATDADGNSVDSSEIISGIVDGLTFGDEMYLSIGGVSVPLDYVTEVIPEAPEN